MNNKITIDELDLARDETVPVKDGVPYFAEGRRVYNVKYDGRQQRHYVITLGRDGHRCHSMCEYDRVPEGAEGCEVCINCDSVKIPAEVLR